MPIDGEGRRFRAALVLGLTAMVMGGAAHVATSAAEAEGEVEAPIALVESAGCGGPPPPQPAPPAMPVTGDRVAAAPIVLFIPPTVFVRLDAHGAPTALMTNTGCAPRPSDRVLVEVDPFHATAPSPKLVATVRALALTGDWRKAGGWHQI